MVIVVPESAWESEIARAVETRLTRDSWTIVVDDDAPAQAVQRARQNHGGQPLG